MQVEKLVDVPFLILTVLHKSTFVHHQKEDISSYGTLNVLEEPFLCYIHGCSRHTKQHLIYIYILFFIYAVLLGFGVLIATFFFSPFFFVFFFSSACI